MIKKGIYRIFNKVNGKFYIGSTGSKGGFKKRWLYHLDDLKNNNHHSIHLQRAWNKYGEDSFSFEIIEIIEDVNLIIKREQYYLDTLKPYDINVGYNICKIAGSSLGVKKTEEQKKKMSELRKGKPIPWMNDGKPRTDEHKKNLSNSLKGRKSEKIGKTYEEFYGEERGKALKLKLSKAHEGQFTGENHHSYGKKIVLQYDKDMNFIKEWASATIAEKELKIPTASISLCCRGGTKTAYGFKWKYKNGK